MKKKDEKPPVVTVLKKKKAAPAAPKASPQVGFTPQVKAMKVAHLIPYVNNAKVHNKEQVAMLAGSIKEFGFVVPVVVDAEGVIIAGHGRVAAAELLGWTEVPVVQVDHLTPTQVKMLRLADNRLSDIAKTDRELLKLELVSLKDMAYDKHGAMGFTDEAVAAMFAGIDGFFEGGRAPGGGGDSDEGDEGGGPKKKVVTCPDCGEMFEVEK